MPQFNQYLKFVFIIAFMASCEDSQRTYIADLIEYETDTSWLDQNDSLSDDDDDTGTGIGGVDTGTGEIEQTDFEIESDTGTGIGGEDTGTGEIEADSESETNEIIIIHERCDNFAAFIDNCYQTSDNFKGPTQTIIQETCGSETIGASAAEWFYCWQKPINDFQCDNNYPPFESSDDKCDHYMACMAWCFM